MTNCFEVHKAGNILHRSVVEMACRFPIRLRDQRVWPAFRLGYVLGHVSEKAQDRYRRYSFGEIWAGTNDRGVKVTADALILEEPAQRR